MKEVIFIHPQQRQSYDFSWYTAVSKCSLNGKIVPNPKLQNLLMFSSDYANKTASFHLKRIWPFSSCIPKLFPHRLFAKPSLLPHSPHFFPIHLPKNFSPQFFPTIISPSSWPPSFSLSCSHHPLLLLHLPKNISLIFSQSLLLTPAAHHPLFPLHLPKNCFPHVFPHSLPPSFPSPSIQKHFPTVFLQSLLQTPAHHPLFLSIYPPSFSHLFTKPSPHPDFPLAIFFPLTCLSPSFPCPSTQKLFPHCLFFLHGLSFLPTIFLQNFVSLQLTNLFFLLLLAILFSPHLPKNFSPHCLFSIPSFCKTFSPSCSPTSLPPPSQHPIFSSHLPPSFSPSIYPQSFPHCLSFLPTVFFPTIFLQTFSPSYLSPCFSTSIYPLFSTIFSPPSFCNAFFCSPRHLLFPLALTTLFTPPSTPNLFPPSYHSSWLQSPLLPPTTAM
nr:uncharacterized protein LOC129049706 [Pongo abelii]